MTEKEKCKQGLLYNPNFDEELIRERTDCKDICSEYNLLSYSLLDERKKLIKKLVGKTGENFLVEQPFWCDYGYNIQLGENFYSNHNLIILDGASVTFGDNVFVGPNCSFYTAGHAENPQQRTEGIEYAYPISVGNNVWIGGNVTVLPGVTIGDNSIIGAGSVVTRDIPENVVAAGNPCKVKRSIKEVEE